MSNKEMDRKEYVSLLEQAIQVHKNAPVSPILGWDGKTDLPHTAKDTDLDKLVEKIAGGKADGDSDREAIEAGKTKETVSEGTRTKSPIAMLEDNLGEAEEDLDLNNLDEVNLHEKESDILTRLISEMDELDSNSNSLEDDDDYLDTDREEIDDTDDIDDIDEDDDVDLEDLD